jgi:GNAT superfamily N-acetyltransferase
LAFDVESDPAKPEWTRTGYISQFLVAETHRQKGVGAQLMEVIDAWFAERGLNKVLLNVNIDNPAGIGFWQKHGFEAYAMRMKRIRQPKAKG